MIYIEVKSRDRASKKARVTARRIREPTTKVSRQEAARQCVAVFDTGFFKALCEPARIAALRELILLGRADIGAIAARLPQDRSVIARHLHQLAATQIVKAKKEGRHVFYEIDAGAVAERLEGILAITRLLQSAMSADTRTARAR
jgi:DNA-binding transcriptional ArsR family regulator